MIQDLFIPNAINNYYLISQKILSFSLNRNHITACQILAAGKTITIQEIYREELEFDSGLTYEQLVSAAIKKIIKKHKFNLITLTIPSTHTIFKELELPFLDAQKINQVIKFEVEANLPFAIDKAVVSFIVTNQDQVKKSSQVLAAIVQKKDLDYYQDLFKKAGLKGIDQFTVELFDSYALFQKIPDYNQAPAPQILLSISDSTTTIIYLDKSKLQLSRIIPRGFAQLARQFAQRAKITYPEALELLKRVNLTQALDHEHAVQLKAVLGEYFTVISATLESFAVNLKAHKTDYKLEFKQMVLLQSEQVIAGLSELIGQTFSTKCYNLAPEKLLANKIFKTNLKLTAADYNPLAAAYNSTMQDHSSLEYARTSSGLLKNQIAVGLIFSSVILGALSIHVFWDLSYLNNKFKKAEIETLSRLNAKFKLDPKKNKILASALKDAETEIERESKIWFAFSRQTHISILEYLKELSEIIKPEELGLQLEALTITDTQMTLKGHVKDRNAVTELTHRLRLHDNLFDLPKKPESTDFDIVLTLKNREQAP